VCEKWWFGYQWQIFAVISFCKYTEKMVKLKKNHQTFTVVLNFNSHIVSGMAIFLKNIMRDK